MDHIVVPVKLEHAKTFYNGTVKDDKEVHAQEVVYVSEAVAVEYENERNSNGISEIKPRRKYLTRKKLLEKAEKDKEIEFDQAQEKATKISRTYGKKKSSGENIKYFCSECPFKTLLDKDSLLQHFKDDHEYSGLSDLFLWRMITNHNSTIITARNFLVNPAAIVILKYSTLECALCNGLKIEKPKDYMHHIQAVHKNYEFKCTHNQCGAIFKMYEEKREHEKEHAPDEHYEIVIDEDTEIYIKEKTPEVQTIEHEAPQILDNQIEDSDDEFTLSSQIKKKRLVKIEAEGINGMATSYKKAHGDYKIPQILQNEVEDSEDEFTITSQIKKKRRVEVETEDYINGMATSYKIAHGDYKHFVCRACPEKTVENWKVFAEHFKEKHDFEDVPSEYLLDLLHDNIYPDRLPDQTIRCSVNPERLIIKKYQTLQCVLCDGRKFEVAQEYKSHILKEHQDFEFKCRHCKKIFKNFRQRRAHNQKFHADIYKDKIKDFGDTKCDICQQYFHSEKTLERHRVHVHTVNIIPESITPQEKKNMINKCIECKASFSKKYFLEAHRLIKHTQPTVQCEYCSKLFHTEKQLKRHQLIHLQNYEFICEICSKGFTRKQRYNYHMQAHDKGTIRLIGSTGEFKCGECEMSFSKSFLLWEHLRLVHKKISPYPSRKASREKKRLLQLAKEAAGE